MLKYRSTGTFVMFALDHLPVTTTLWCDWVAAWMLLVRGGGVASAQRLQQYRLSYINHEPAYERSCDWWCWIAVCISYAVHTRECVNHGLNPDVLFLKSRRHSVMALPCYGALKIVIFIITIITSLNFWKIWINKMPSLAIDWFINVSLARCLEPHDYQIEHII